MKGRLAAAPRSAAMTTAPRAPAGAFVVLDGQECFRISGYRSLAPFLMTVASDTDLWMFVASGGGLTAGRIDADGSLFPYLTDDQLHDAHHHTGPVTLVRVEREQGDQILWEPFGAGSDDQPAVERNLYKNTTGNRLTFEEVHHGLGLELRYSWAACDEFGWVRTVTLENRSATRVRVQLLDGLRNVLPYGAPLALYQRSSNLVDAYKRTEADPETGLGIFALTAGITDRAEALEVLRANTVWCCGPQEYRVHLSPAALTAFREGRVLAGESLLCGARGNYLVSFGLDLAPGASKQWRLIADAGRDHLQVAALRDLIQNAPDLQEKIAAGLRQAGDNLRRNVGSADGLQLTARRASWSHHFANVLFNNMRGGVFWRDHEVPVADFVRFLGVRHPAVADRHRSLLSCLPATLTAGALRDTARATGDADFARLCHEYLPLYFGRRHGDPSRPWNRFSIKVRNRDGEQELNYEGNWRDIFQNWEALGASFPGFLPNLVAKFVNASTVDGFNPYRVTREGVDWETSAPDDPWSNIGYWGDHQLVYLLKLLEGLQRTDPAALRAMLGEEIFSYADIPYRIRPYAQILADPRNTIEFDTARAALVAARVAARGTDGKLLTDADGGVHHANLCEKLLVPVLSKLSNLILDAGIWMNTQRPEWNDANNALGGGGVSVVTLCYLRRYLSFFAEVLADSPAASLPLSREVAAWFREVDAILTQEIGCLTSEPCEPQDRKRLMDRLGGAFSDYRGAAYDRGLTGSTAVPVADLAELCRTALRYVDRGIAANRRADGLYHAYNLLEIDDDGTAARVARLPEMLEGQVAALSSGLLDPAECLAVLEGLFVSALYRPSQRSFMLYPERELTGFIAKNVLPDAAVAAIPLLRDLLAAGDTTLIARDKGGVLRFLGSPGNARDLDGSLEALAAQARWSTAVARDRDAVLALFEAGFRHKAYTGRSGAMYGYEGLGCVYWHMVAKLLLAVQEVLQRAEREGRPAQLRQDLADMYFRIRAGLGYEKTVAEYGAFPADPYSHTPAGGGARQPGMTGQVKEEILTRFGELGVCVQGGSVSFQPTLLRADEFLEHPAEFHGFDAGGDALALALPAGSLAFTFCQTPVIYRLVRGEARIQVIYRDGSPSEFAGCRLDVRSSEDLLERNGLIGTIEAEIPEHTVHPATGPRPRAGTRAPRDRSRSCTPD
ncbi:MAG: hypothetical protein IPI34_02545 [bacterium]|nr:hypothetical protein [bacterium]